MNPDDGMLFDNVESENEDEIDYPGTSSEKMHVFQEATTFDNAEPLWPFENSTYNYLFALTPDADNSSSFATTSNADNYNPMDMKEKIHEHAVAKEREHSINRNKIGTPMAEYYDSMNSFLFNSSDLNSDIVNKYCNMTIDDKVHNTIALVSKSTHTVLERIYNLISILMQKGEINTYILSHFSTTLKTHIKIFKCIITHIMQVYDTEEIAEANLIQGKKKDYDEDKIRFQEATKMHLRVYEFAKNYNFGTEQIAILLQYYNQYNKLYDLTIPITTIPLNTNINLFDLIKFIESGNALIELFSKSVIERQIKRLKYQEDAAAAWAHMYDVVDKEKKNETKIQVIWSGSRELDIFDMTTSTNNITFTKTGTSKTLIEIPQSNNTKRYIYVVTGNNTYKVIGRCPGPTYTPLDLPVCEYKACGIDEQTNSSLVGYLTIDANEHSKANRINCCCWFDHLNNISAYREHFISRRRRSASCALQQTSDLVTININNMLYYAITAAHIARNNIDSQTVHLTLANPNTTNEELVHHFIENLNPIAATQANMPLAVVVDSSLTMREVSVG